ncbi:hypothetical protein [Halomontanus rarus]|uniref:hypothetical protein n=1 Tax=Halomontanus rarus TaxID=3034020 RepID=UPI0023E85DB2|nr:hypothetical protein [Halovivax sp. TS33]
MTPLNEIVDVAVQNVDSPDRLERVLTSPGNSDGAYVIREGSSWHYYEQERGGVLYDVTTTNFTDAARYVLARNADQLIALLPLDRRAQVRTEAEHLCRIRANLDIRRPAWRLDGRSLFVPSRTRDDSDAVAPIAAALGLEAASIRPVDGPPLGLECRLPVEPKPTAAIARLRDAFVLPVARVEMDGRERVLPAPGVESNGA